MLYGVDLHILFRRAIFYLFGGKDGALKEVLSMTASFFGGIATLVAAYIATQLFNDWKDQEKYRITSSLALDCLKDYLAAKDMLFFYLFFLQIFPLSILIIPHDIPK